ncbi:neutrophil cytosol factor 2-like [Argonauta hians]
MSSKLTLKELAQSWDQSVSLYEEGKMEECAALFANVAPHSTAKISYNLGCVYLKMDKNPMALKMFQQTLQKDAHFVAAYVQMGALYLQYNMCEAGIKCYEAATMLMGTKKYINYRPLGLNLVLYLTEVLHNQAVAESKVENWKQVERLMNLAISSQLEEKFSQKLRVSLQDLQQRRSLTPFPLPTGIFHPPKWMTQNLQNINFLGDSKVISMNNDPFSMRTFNGTTTTTTTSNNNNNNNKPSEAPLPQWSVYKNNKVTTYKQLDYLVAELSTMLLDSASDKRKLSERTRLNNDFNNDHHNRRNQPLVKPASKTPPTRPPPPLPANRNRLAVPHNTRKFASNEHLSQQENSTAPPAGYKKVGVTVRVKYSVHSSNPNILSVSEGDQIQVKSLGTDWFQGRLMNKTGLVPWNCIHQR